MVCFSNGVQQPASSFNAIIGNVNRSSPDSKQIFLRKVTAHPQYDNLENDLAILETTTPIEYTDRIQPICIADSNFPKLILKSVTAMGWGQDSRSLLHSCCQFTYIHFLVFETIQKNLHEFQKKSYFSVKVTVNNKTLTTYLENTN